MLGLFGVMMAGLAADAVFSFRDDDNDEAEPPAPDDGEPSLDDGDLLDDLSGDPPYPPPMTWTTRSIRRSRLPAPTVWTSFRATTRGMTFKAAAATT